MEILSKYLLYVCVFIYIININRTHILYKQTFNLFAINPLTSLVLENIDI